MFEYLLILLLFDRVSYGPWNLAAGRGHVLISNTLKMLVTIPFIVRYMFCTRYKVHGEDPQVDGEGVCGACSKETLQMS